MLVFNQLRQIVDEKNLSARFFNVQYLGELVKFKVLSFPTIFKCLKAMLDEFNPSHVQEMRS